MVYIFLWCLCTAPENFRIIRINGDTDDSMMFTKHCAQKTMFWLDKESSTDLKSNNFLFAQALIPNPEYRPDI